MPSRILLRCMIALFCFAVTSQLHAQSDDALINKLIEKGILTIKEAKDLRKESSQNVPKDSSRQAAFPDWVSSFKFNGDFRGRYEGHYSENPAFVDRHRLRYRLRLGATVALKDDFEIGIRLTSSDPVSGFSNNSGNPLSGSSIFQDNGSRKFIYIDLAYAKWIPHGDGWSASFAFGKMESPFPFSPLVFDPDYNPEGLAAQLSLRITERHTLKFNAGAFVLDELSSSSSDPYLGGAQLRMDSQWTPKVATSFGFSGVSILNHEVLNNANVPNVNRGNTRDATGAPATSFNTIVADTSVSFLLDSFPGYSGHFPLKLGSEFMHNIATPSKNDGFSAGVTFGKGGKKGLWETAYHYRYLESDAWYEEFPDDDFGAFYSLQQSNAGFAGAGAGFGGGTNVRGHVFRATYWLFDSLSLGLTYYYGELVYPVSGGRNGASHMMADMVWRF